MRVIEKWDKSSKNTREQILTDFIHYNQQKSGPQLDLEMTNGASLFLTRITAWLRLTYLSNVNLSLQLKAISVFISASHSSRYIAEFMEVGGVLALLEILGLQQIKEEEKAEAMKLLYHIACAGKLYREIICENYGIRIVLDCLGKAEKGVVHENARVLLQQLATDNSKYSTQIYKALLATFTSTNVIVSAQQLAGQVLRTLLPSITNVHHSIVDATVGLLKSLHEPIQKEGYELLRDLMQRPNLQEAIIFSLIGILASNATIDDVEDDWNDTHDYGRKVGKFKLGLETNKENVSLLSDASVAAYIQRSLAAKLLGFVAATLPHLVPRMIDLNIISGLLMAITNIQYPDCQKSAAETLYFLCEHYSRVTELVKEYVGNAFYEVLHSRPDTFWTELSSVQINYLKRNALRAGTKRINGGGRAVQESLAPESEPQSIQSSFESMNEASVAPRSDHSESIQTSSEELDLHVSFTELVKLNENSAAATQSGLTSESTALPRPSLNTHSSSMSSVAEKRSRRGSAGVKVHDRARGKERDGDKQATVISENIYVPFQQVASKSPLSAAKFVPPSQIDDAQAKFRSDLEKYKAANSESSRSTPGTNRATGAPQARRPSTINGVAIRRRSSISVDKPVEINIPISAIQTERFTRSREPDFGKVAKDLMSTHKEQASGEKDSIKGQ
ncbi:armadillo-type protein [Paraphysoderma sedebokerense]|nr:armadillo-type protein [Paraphysoderma sedebokerense]